MSTPAPAARPAAPTGAPVAGWRIGSLAGAPVYLGRSWPIIAVFITVVFGPVLQRPGRGTAYGYLVAFGYALLVLVSVLVHEAAHAYAARWTGHPVSRVVADVWGGHTVYDATRSSPRDTAFVAVVGPLSNLALAGVGWAMQGVATNDTASTLVTIFTLANVFVGVFNLLPGLPLDGGQIVSALVWGVTGRRGPGLVAAGWLGRLVAVVTVGWLTVRPLVSGETRDVFEVLWPVFIGYFLWRGASQAIRAGQIHDATAGPASIVLEQVLALPGTVRLVEIDERARVAERNVWVVAQDEAGWPYGVLDPEAAARVPAGSRATTELGSVVVAQPPEWVVPLAHDAVLTDLVRIMSDRSLSVAVVIDESSRRLLGLATAQHVNDVVAAALGARKR